METEQRLNMLLSKLNMNSIIYYTVRYVPTRTDYDKYKLTSVGHTYVDATEYMEIRKESSN